MSKKFDDDFFGCAESCPKMRDRGLEIQKLNEKICAYKAKVRDLYQVDISDLKKTIRCLKERIEELECENERLNEFVAPTMIHLVFHDDINQFELLCNDREISDHVYDALTQAERRIEELRVENDKLKRENGFIKFRDGFVKFEIRIDELKKSNDELAKRVEELEDENKKLKDLRDHLTNLGIKKESEIVNLKEENEKLLNENKYWKDKYETLDKGSTDGSYIYISIPKGQKVSNFEVHFQGESSPISSRQDFIISPTGGNVHGHNDSISK